MINFAVLKKTAAALLLVAGLAAAASAQAGVYPAPREGKLLNGTRILVWSDPGAPKVSVVVRIHSGAAFDPAGKEGVMQLLTDILLPAETTKEFFQDELGGSFETVTNFDYIEIRTTGDTDKLSTIMETLANAITNPQINKEATARVREALLARIAAKEKEAPYVVERLAARRLFGTYPYGRAPHGTTESIAKIDFADLLDLESRLFTADNATIAITGDVNPEQVLRVAKRSFSAWLKADRKVPPTFAQPAPADAKPLDIALADAPGNFIASAKTAAARNDKDYWASEIAIRVMRARVCKNGESLTYDAHLLKGVVGVVAAGTGEIPCRAVALDDEAAAGEIEAARNALVAYLRAKYQTKAGIAAGWLDTETFKLVSLKDDVERLNAVTVADVRRVAAALGKDAGVTVKLSKTGN